MRITSSVTSVSWIPSEAITGTMKLPVVIGVAHWDPPPPDIIDDLEQLRLADRFRFANELRAWIEVEGDAIVAAGYDGGGRIGATTLSLGGLRMTLPGVSFPDIQHEPEFGDGRVRFVQTTGGRTGAPMPRTVQRPPFVQIVSPVAWTTLALTLHADGTVEREVVGASPFPRHWIYDVDGRLEAKTGITDYRSWAGQNFGDWSPWGDRDQDAIVADAESALERQLSTTVMRGGAKPKIRKLHKGATLTEQGTPGDELYLVLDGMLTVEVDREPVADVGPGAILGERAMLEGGSRTSTLRAITACRVAVAHADQLDRDALFELSEGHRREERPAADAAAG